MLPLCRLVRPGTVPVMRIVGHGIDLVEVDYFRRLLERGSEDALGRSFTAWERDHAAQGPDPAEGLAGRFAAKEAVLKALGVGWTGDIAWTDIEIKARASGAPHVVLHASALDLAARLGVTNWLVSITHTGTSAASSVIAISEPDAPAQLASGVGLGGPEDD